jgi:RND family efflux transporter MFP subunit
MKKLILIIVALAAAVSIGYELGARRMQMGIPDAAASPAGNQGKPARKIRYYWDPMLGPSSIADKPGKSAMGMDLVPVYEDEALGAGTESSGGPEVRVESAVVQNMGIRMSEVTRGPLIKSIRTVGVLRVPEPNQHDLALKINGWIERLYADTEWMHVKRGEALYEVYSPDLQVASEELIGAMRALHAIDPAAPDEVRRQGQALVDSARQKLRLWDVDDEQIDKIAKATVAPPTVLFYSPFNGDVTDKMVMHGSNFQAGAKLIRIEDRSTLWLEAVVYEDQISMLAIGQEVQATVAGMPGKVFKGKISFIYPRIDPATRTVTVRVVLDNADLQLIPGQYVTADIVTRPVADAIQVPREAVIDTGTRQIAFVVRSPGQFDPVEVHMGLVGDDGRVQVISGLEVGQSVVTSGQFLLDVESRTTEAINKLRSAPTTQPAGAQP